MVVGNVIFQTVDVMLVHAAAEIFYFIQQKLACGIVQNIIQRIVCHGAERQQGSLVEVAHHILVVSPRSHFFDTLHSFIGVAAVFGEQIGANQYVCVGFFAVDDAAAFTGKHGILLHFVGQSLRQVRIDVVYGLHRRSEYLVGTFEVSLAFNLSLAALYETVPFILVKPYAGMVGRQVFKYDFQSGRTEFMRIGFYRKL